MTKFHGAAHGAANSKRGSKQSGPQKIGDVLAQLMARRGYAQEQLAGAYAEAWSVAAGPVLAPHSLPGNMRRGVLEVTVRNSSTLQELMFRKHELLSELARVMPEKKIDDLRFRVGAID